FPPSALQKEESLPSFPLQPQPSLSAYAVVYTRDIFNSVKAPTSTPGATPSATTGAANLRLLGTATSVQDRAFAILEEQTTRSQGLYREGEMIAPGVTLVLVGWDRVIIERGGQRETLML